MAEQQNFSSMLSVGTLLHDTFRIDRYLSSGGFGNTYVATNLNFNEVVAIKEFFMKGVNQRNGDNVTVSVSNNDNLHAFESQKKKFKKEAQRLHTLHNPHIVHVHDLFEENGTIYYVMDYIDGMSLREKMKRLGHPMHEVEVIDILKQVLDALDEVHKLQIYHLDLKPANIMLDKHNVAIVIDFGASKQLSSDDNASTSTGVSYTEGYAPTEQIERNFEKIGPWTDFYALGATLYNLLSNRKPSRSSDVIDDDTPDKHISLPMPPTVSKPMKNLVLWMMQGKRSNRPQNVKEILDYIDFNFGNKASYEGEINNSTDSSEDYSTVFDDTIKNGSNAHSYEGHSNSDVELHDVKEPYIGKQRNSSKIVKLCVLSLLLVGVILFGWKAYTKNHKEEPAKTEEVAKDVKNFRYQTKDNTYYWTGKTVKGAPNGQGLARFTDGREYSGTMKNGLMVSVSATFSFTNGDTYEGSFTDDHFDTGTYTIKEDGSYFTGKFDASGQPSHGIWYDRTGNVIQTLK